MKINSININGFGKLENKEIKFDNGINIISGQNESGKSTLLQYIYSMFFGVAKAKKGKDMSDFDKYNPWHANDFSGELEYMLDDNRKFKVYRDFKKGTCKIFNNGLEDISSEFNINKSKGNMFFYDQTGIDEDLLVKTAITKQEDIKLDKDEQKTLIGKMANLMQTGDDNVSFNKTIDRLNKKLIDEVGTDRTQGRPINIVREKIKLNKNLKNELDKYKEKQYTLEEEKSNLEVELKKYLLKLTLYKAVRQVKEKQLIKINEKDFEENIKPKDEGKKKNYILISAIIIILTVLMAVFYESTLIRSILIGSIILSITIIIYKIYRYEGSKSKSIKQKTEDNESILIQEDIDFVYKELLGKVSKSEILNVINETYEKIISNNTLLEEKCNNLKLAIHKLEIEKENILPKLEEIVKIEEELESLEEENGKLESLSWCIKLAQDILEMSYVEMKQNIEPSITEDLAKTIAFTTDNKYKNIGFNDEDGILVKLESGDVVNVNRLSTGTIDQMYLALRLATLKKITGSNECIPIILDEPFAYYDKERLESILKYINNLSISNQIIIFTCTKRDMKALDRLNISYNLIEML